MKPTWHTCELRPKGAKSLIRMAPPKGGKPWTMWHYVNPRARNTFQDFLNSHVIYAWFFSDGLAKPSTLRRYRRTIFEPGRWTHVAWVWGQEKGIVPGNPPYHKKVRDNVLIARIFIDGKQGGNWGYRWYKNQPVDMPLSLLIGNGGAKANLDAVIDELRISDVQRYRDDFEPSRKAEFQADEHTRALFHFNGDLKGRSHGGPAPTGTLTK